MRFKKAPLRTTGMEHQAHRTGKLKILNLGDSGMVKGEDGRPRSSPEMETSLPVLTKLTHSHAKVRNTYELDPETQAAQAKLRQFEALGHIKVELDEDKEVSQHDSEDPLTPPQLSNQAGFHYLLPGTSSSEASIMQQIAQQQGQVIMSIVQQPQHPSSSGLVQGGMLDVPILTDTEGEFGFTVTVEEKERTTKSPMWLMSKVVNKLYTNLNKSVPFEVRTRKPIDPSQFMVRAVLVFSSPQFLRTNVTRCPNHTAATDPTNHDFPYPNHVVRADHPDAQYVTNPQGRLSVVVPLDTLPDGTSYTPILLRFMCLGSCVGGISRRPIAIILTLEDRSGMVHGRRVVDIRVCACPTRDIKSDEQAYLNKGLKRKGSFSQSEKQLPPGKRSRVLEPKSDPDDDGFFHIRVRGRQLYEFLMKMKSVYYETHVEYAVRYPDDTAYPPNSYTSHLNGEKMKENGEDPDGSAWDSEGDSGKDQHQEDSQSEPHPVPSASQGAPAAPPPLPITTHSMQLLLIDKAGSSISPLSDSLVQSSSALRTLPSYSESIVSSQGNTTSAMVLTSVADMNKTSPADIITLPTVSLPSLQHRHIPVMQVVKQREPLLQKVSRNKGGAGGHASFHKPKIQSKANSPKKKNTSGRVKHSKKYGESRTLASDAILTPDSPEMLAASVLAQGFGKEGVRLRENT